ncbi:MAG: VWA domain-containing protein [Nocardioides sp.]|nr:VWA domain-containing protein [Nocardioides sp.]
MSLASPVWLWVLVPVALLAAAYVAQQRRRSGYAVRFATLPMLETLLPRRPDWRRHLPAALVLLSFAALVVALSRPQVETQVPAERATVMVVVDVSLSMRAVDVAPDRITAARTAAQGFILGLPAGFNVGVVSFAGAATVLDAPGPDRDAAVAALDRLQLDEGTAIGDGVLTSLAQIDALAAQTPDTSEPVPAQVVLLSDGTNTVGRPVEQAVAAAVEDGVPVSTIAYGTPEGTVTVDGQTIPVPVDIEALAALADRTGGRAYEAETADQLSQVYADIQSSIGLRSEQRDVTPYAVGLGLLLGMLGAAGSLRWSSRIP